MHRSRSTLLGASLCGLLGLTAACTAETQPLNSVADDAGGSGGSGIGGSAGESGDSDTSSTAAIGGSDASGGGGGREASGGTGGSDASGGSDTSSTAAMGGSDASGGTGGSDASGGTGGGDASGGTGGGTVEPRDVLAEKLDILFVVDNSISMETKQPFLATAAADLLDRLANPRCVDGDDPALAEGCPEGQHREFAPVVDMHIGVISTSLGGHGGELCSPNEAGASSWNPTKNDAGKLLPSVREQDELTSYKDQGFLAWDLLEVDEDAEHDLGKLKTDVSEQILSAGAVGCGYEAPLEAMYRFLIDPSPPKEIVVTDNLAHPATDNAGNVLVDTDLLEQRANFLRPDSALAVVLLSDEDDCSVQDSGLGWITAETFTLPRETQTCETDPSDPCCRSCGVATEVAGCPSTSQDPNCIEGRDDSSTDALALRCFDQKRRFGLDLLYPVDRYVAGLTKTQIEDPWSCSDEECPLVRNPLFPPEDPELAFTRRASEVFMVSMVGVPWQDLATSGSLTGDGLTYRSAFDADDWSLVVGDPLMVESIDPRSGTHPVTGEPLAPEDSTNPLENSINGHEFANVSNDMLQNACTFPLASPKDCSVTETGCDCGAGTESMNSPLCQPPDGGEAAQIQYFAAATPAPRILELMSKLPRAVPASACPKIVEGDADTSDYGYNPAMRALVSELSSILK